jgi:hypothetical protein
MPSLKIPATVLKHRADVWRWFKTVQDPDHPTFIRLCSQGDLLYPSASAGLGWAALALKLANMINLFPLAGDGFQEAMVRRVKAFQRSRGADKGHFIDRHLLRSVDVRRAWILRSPNIPVRRAETRQALTALMGLGEMPTLPPPLLAETEEDVRRYIRSLPWEKDAWGSCSHASHLAIFLGAGPMMTGKKPTDSALLPIFFEEMDRYFCPETGSWHVGMPSATQIMNAAMKAYTAYAFLGLAVPQPERAIDFVLDQVLSGGACNFVDALYVLHSALNATEHRRDEIEIYAYSLIEKIEQHRQPDGGLCYSGSGTQRTYYGMTVSKGLKGIGDLHGTKLFTWSFVLIADILGWREELGWKLPLA